MSADQGERKQPNETSRTTNPRPVWRRAGVWVGGVVAAALATVLAGTLTQGFGWFANVVGTQGEPVEVRVDVEARADDVVLPPEATMSDDELAELSGLPMEEQVVWLEQHEHGNVAGAQTVTLYLTGNRPDPVRITDLTSTEDCDPIARGTLVRMQAGRGAGADSEVVNILVGQGPSKAYLEDQTGQQQDYFPERTITLAKDEEVPLVVHLVPDFSGSICQVQLELTVREADAERQVQVLGQDGPFTVMSIELEHDEAQYGTVYLGGDICRQYVVAVPDWSMNPPCGEGNFAR